jgi:hypothetical protein
MGGKNLISEKKLFLIFKIFLALMSVYVCIQINSVCTGGNYYDTTLMDCQACPTNQEVTSDGKRLIY